MNRFCAFVLLAFLASTVARNVHENRDSRSDSDEEKQVAYVDFVKNPKSDALETTISPTILPTVSSTSSSTTIDGDDSVDWMSTMATTKAAFRKRRAANTIKESKKSASSEEFEGSGDKDSAPANSIAQSPLINSGEDQPNSLREDESNSSMANSTLAATMNSSANELESGENETASALTSNQIDPKTAERGEIAVLKEKVHCWQKAVDNYLAGSRRRRKRQQSTWSQLFPGTSSTTYNSAQGSNFASVAGYAVGDAMKPAMDLMTQGVNLLGDLYQSQLTRSDAYSVAKQGPTGVNNDTIAVDQFRNQLQQLQTKLGDLGTQLQRVVSSFQQMQLPFNILSGGLFPSNAQPSASNAITGKDNTVIGKAKNDKNL